MSRTRNASRNILWGILNKIITLGLPFITRTVMIYTMGMDYVGLGSLFSSILQVLSFADLGIGGAIVFSMYKPIAEGDDEKVCALLNFYRKAYRIIGLVILVAGLAVMPFLNYLVAKDLPAGINLQILFLVYLFNNIFGYFLFAYKHSLFNASQRVDVASKLWMCLQLLLSISQIIILLVFRNYYAYVIVIPVITVLNNLIGGFIADKMFPQYKAIGRISTSEKKEIEKKVGGMLFQKIGLIILSSADTLVISAFLGLKVLGIYNGYSYIVTALFGFFTVIQQAMIPSIGNSTITDTTEKNLNDFKKFHFLYLWIIIWFSACLLGLYQPFIRLWQGADNMLPFIDAVLLVVYFFTNKMGDVCWMYREALGLWWEARYIPLVSSIFNLIVNIALVNFIGLPGIIISTILALTFINFPFNAFVLFSKIFKSKKECIAYMARTGIYFVEMVFVAGITWWGCELIPGFGILNLLARACICAVLPNILLLAVQFKNKEFKPAGQFVLKILPQRLVPGFIKKLFI